MRDEPWMHMDRRSLGERISDLQNHARDCERRANQLEVDARKLRQEARETERQIENLRTAR